MSPFNAWVFLKGLETLAVRMPAHTQRAGELATWLEQQSGVKRVYYPGLASHPQYALSAQQQNGAGGLLSFELDAGKEAAWRFIDATRMISITANLGDAKTTVTHPATTTHGRLSDQERATAGISDGLIRIAVGLEDVEDLRDDFQRGLDALA
jgi:O-succinylhomoserine sulfhydrylase